MLFTGRRGLVKEKKILRRGGESGTPENRRGVWNTTSPAARKGEALVGKEASYDFVKGFREKS